MSSEHQQIGAKNASFFDGNAEYADRVSQLDTYRHIRAAIERELASAGALIDVGNGGVFEYDTSLADRIVAVDLFLDDDRGGPENVVFRRGDALDLPEASGTYDTALYAFVFHHLTGKDATAVVENTRRALAEADRVLKDDGVLVVAESCVPQWFYRLEQPLFVPLAALARTRVMKHPPTLQLPASLLRSLISERFDVERYEAIPVGRWVIQLGFRWPTAATPARPVLIQARKRSR